MHIFLSAVAGLVFGVGNLAMLSLITKGFARGSSKAVYIILLFVKFAVLVALLWFCFAYLKLNLLALAAGLTLPIIVFIFRKGRFALGDKR